MKKTALAITSFCLIMGLAACNQQQQNPTLDSTTSGEVKESPLNEKFESTDDVSPDTDRVVNSDIITEEEAKAIALERIPGTVLSVIFDEKDDFDDNSEYEVTIQSDRGIYTIEIDARTGAILDIDDED